MSANNKSSSQDLRLSVQKRLAKIDKNRIRNWFASASRGETPERLVREILNVIIKCIGISSLPIAQHRLYRCRPWNSDNPLPTQLSKLLAPPIECTVRNRCNLDKNPTLYVSVHPGVLANECHVKPNEKYIILQFERMTDVEDLGCVLLGMEPVVEFDNDPHLIEMENYKKRFYGKHYKKIKLIETLLHREFVRVDDPTGLTYRITSNLVDLIFGKAIHVDGICYPSIASNGSVNNLALKPNSIFKAYKPVKAGLYQLSNDGTSIQLDGAVVKKDEITWGETVEVDNPVPVRIKSVNPDDSSIYIAPWR